MVEGWIKGGRKGIMQVLGEVGKIEGILGVDNIHPTPEHVN